MIYPEKGIGDLFPNMKIGGTPSRGNPIYFGGDNLWVSIKDMDNQPIISKTSEMITDIGVKNSNCKLVKKGSLLFSFKLTVGRISFAGKDLYTNEAIAAFGPDEAKAHAIDLNYLSLVLPLAAAIDTTKNCMGAPLLNKDKIKSLKVPIPPVNIQHRIATRLKAQLAEMEKARQAADAQLVSISDLCEQGMERALQNALETADEKIHLGDIVSISAKLVNPTLQEYCKLPHVSAENILSVTGEFIGLQSAADDGMKSNKYLFEAGDVLYSKLRPYLRKVALPNFAGLCSADMYPLKIDSDRINAGFLRILLTSKIFTEYANEKSARSRMPKLNREQLFNWEFTLPSLNHQQECVRKIEGVLTQISNAHAAAMKMMVDLKILPTKILSQAFET